MRQPNETWNEYAERLGFPDRYTRPSEEWFGREVLLAIDNDQTRTIHSGNDPMVVIMPYAKYKAMCDDSR